ncbi:hypothetical protein J4210_00350 [Candidatus Woesearchaeota archaeon]|nr:hypothetical protein [Candidatus Woesearchaeota archaeon]
MDDVSQKELDFTKMQELLPGVIAKLEGIRKGCSRITERSFDLYRNREFLWLIKRLFVDLDLLSKKLEEFLRWENMIKENVPLITNFAHRLIIIIKEISEIETKMGDLISDLRERLDLPKLKKIVGLIRKLAAECKRANQVNSQEIALTAHARTMLKKTSFLGNFFSGGTLLAILSRINAFRRSIIQEGTERYTQDTDNFLRELNLILGLYGNKQLGISHDLLTFFRLIPEDVVGIILQEDQEEKVLSRMLKYHQKRLIEIEKALNLAAEQIALLVIESENKGIRTHRDLDKRLKLISQALADLRSAAQSYIKKSAGALTVISEGGLSLSAAGHLSESKG